jgi:cytochrome c oxidase subunit 3
MTCVPPRVPVQLAAGSDLLRPPTRTPEAPPPRMSDDIGPPPSRWGGGGGGGDGDDDPPEDPSPRGSGAAELAFGFFLTAVCTLFLVFILAYVLARRSAPVWPPEGSPRPPAGLWISTLLLAATSASMAITMRRRSQPSLRTGLFQSALLGSAFLAVQAWLWRELALAGLSTVDNAYGAVFYSLTGLHAVHVVGGVIALLFLLLRAWRPERGEPGSLLREVRLCALYWHTMGVLWLVIFGLLAVPD